MLKVTVYVCARYVAQNYCLWSGDLQQNLEDGYGNLKNEKKRKRNKKNWGAYQISYKGIEL